MSGSINSSHGLLLRSEGGSEEFVGTVNQDFNHIEGSWRQIKNSMVSSSMSFSLSLTDEACELTDDRLRWLFKQIPDHAPERINRNAFSKSFADILERAYKKGESQAEPGEMPPHEFLWYWYNGNGDEWPLDSKKSFMIVSQEGNKRDVILKMDNDAWNMHSTFRFSVVFENGNWVLDNWEKMKETAQSFVNE